MYSLSAAASSGNAEMALSMCALSTTTEEYASALSESSRPAPAQPPDGAFHLKEAATTEAALTSFYRSFRIRIFGIHR